MQSFLRRNATMAGWAGAFGILALSYIAYLLRETEFPWQAHHYDHGDYRLIAEYFWNVPFDATTYAEEFSGDWGSYLRHVPFRDIGIGTLLLLYMKATSWLHEGLASDGETIAHGFAHITQLCLAASSLIAFAAIRKRYGALIGLLCLAILVFVPDVWLMADDFLTEPWSRCLMLLLLATILSADRLSSLRLAWISAALLMVMVEVKMQWMGLLLFLVPALALHTGRRRTALRTWADMVIAFALIPLTLSAVHYIGWRTTALSPGIALHVNAKEGGQLGEKFCAIPRNASSVLCDESRPKVDWWHVYGGPDARPSDFAALDAFAKEDIASRPADIARDFTNGLLLAGNFPETAWTHSLLQILARALDTLCWLLLIIGACRKRMQLLAAFGLGLWIVPAIGLIYSAYDPRYYRPMAGVVLVIAICILSDLASARRRE